MSSPQVLYKTLTTMCLHDQVEAQAQRTPNLIAVVSEGQELSYRDLNETANCLGRHLKTLGAAPEVLVGICMDRSLEMVISLLAVLKAGGAYVPLDPAYPPERLRYMIEDSQIKVLLTSKHHSTGLPPVTCSTLCVDNRNEWMQEQGADSRPGALPENLAYVIYTSGSTGLPKGVCITHASICNHMDWMQDTFHFSSEDRILQKTPFSFDASVWEFYAPLLCGGTLVMARPEGHRDPDYLVDTIIEQGITTLQLVPSQLKMLLQADKLERCGTLRRVFCGGEALEKKDVEQLLKRLKSCQVTTNLYGPTECTIDATSWSHTGGVIPEMIPVGKPIANARAYIGSVFGEKLKDGSRGELLIGGRLLARGYLRRADLTAEKFVPDPLSGQPGARLYKTGDLAAWNHQDELEYYGRLDHQLKIRGYRVELGEIEAVLAKHALVRDAIVNPWGEGAEKRLAGYIVPADSSLDATDLRQHLKSYLPEHMVPSALIFLEQLPLTENGKLDRKALPEPREQWTGLMDFEEPVTPMEKRVAEIWKSVLQVERVGRYDNFFSLGGHSLLATLALSRLRHQVQINIPLRAMFHNPTVAGIAEVAERDSAGAEVAIWEAGHPRRCSREGDLPLSFSQERVWFLEKLHPGNLAYNYQTLLRFEGPLSISALELALERVVARHEILRTTFHEKDGRPVQRVHPPYQIKLNVIDLQQSEDPESDAQRLVQEEIRKPFQLGELPLINWLLFRLRTNHHLLLHKEHHMLHDGWSFNLLLKELLESYKGYCVETSIPLPELAIQFSDFAQWQREWIKSEEAQSQLNYWKSRLADSSELPSLAGDFSRPAVSALRGAVRRVDLPPELSDELRDESRKQRTTLFMTTFTAFLVLLHRLSGATDICVGSGVANRRWQETENLVGMLVNNVVLRTDLSNNPSIGKLLEQVREVTLGAYANQDIPFDKVVEALHPKRDPSSNPLFQVMFSFHDSPLVSFEGIGPKISMCEGINNGSAKWDLNVVFIPRAEQKPGYLKAHPEPITMIWEYSTDLFRPETVENWIQIYENILRAMVLSVEQRIADVPLVSSRQRQTLLNKWNRNRTVYPREATLEELFVQQVKRRPSSKAITYEGQSLTYRELNERANQLAHYLRRKGVGPETFVGISGERSLEMVIGVLAAVKAGAAYVPLDPDTPPRRQQWLVQDMGMKAILAVDRGQQAFSESGVEVISMDGQIAEISKESEHELEVRVTPENLACIIYTSGSTGTPKGVAIPHRGIVRLVQSPNYAELHPEDKFLQFSPLTFDPSALEIWGSLLNGAELVIMTAGKPSLEALGKVIRESRITVLWLSSGLFHLMAEHCVQDLQTVRQVLAGGDVVPVNAVRRYLNGNPGARFVDGYGPTENSTFTCCHILREGDQIGSTVPVGKPVSNTQVYVLDENLNPAPFGVVGELYTGGDGLARGYLNRPELTAERFIPNPFSEIGGERLYKIGDLVRLRTDDVIEFLGRRDHQVKIRGFRVELGEIEAVLGQHAGVRASIVLVQADAMGQKNLVAFVVAQEGVTRSELREYLKGRLPGYMVPVAIVMVDQMPLTTNGKIDRRKLLEHADLDRSAMADGPPEEYAEPRSESERIVADLWAEMLEVERVGVHDNFFDLGGHSLLLMRMLSRIKELFGVEISLREVFKSPTISSVSRLITLQSGHRERQSWVIERRGLARLPVSFAQRRLWFLEYLSHGESLYNIPVAHRIKGHLDLEALEKSVNHIIVRHETLRTRFEVSDDEPIQVIERELKIRLEYEDLQGISAHEKESVLQTRIWEEARVPFELSRLPLVRMKAFQISREEFVLLISIHHLVADGWSLQVFYQELQLLYGAYKEGRTPALNHLPIQYADYTLWQHEKSAEKLFEPELRYWRKQLSGAPEALQIPTDHARPEVSRYAGVIYRFEMDQNKVTQLRALSRRHGVTLSMVLLSVYSVLLHRWSEQEDIVIGLPVAARTQEQFQRLIGLFVNMMPIRINLHGNPTFADVLKRVRSVALEAYAHQDLPFEQLVDDLNPGRSLNRNPLFQVVFNMLTASDTALRLADAESVPFTIDSGNAKFDLYLEIVESDACLSCRLIHDIDIFAEGTAAEIHRRFEQLIREVVTDENQHIKDLNLLGSDEKRLLHDTVRIEEPEESFLL